jgi:hypothetical protein
MREHRGGGRRLVSLDPNGEGDESMADEREPAGEGRREPARAGKVRPQRYPPVNQTDGIEAAPDAAEVAGEARSFDPAAEGPEPRDLGAENAVNERRLGPEGDPAEGKD